MWKSHPGKWFLWAPLTVGPAFLASLLITTSPLLQQLDVAAKESLFKVGAGWARLEMDGRDSILLGDAPEESVASAAIEALASTPGIRIVDNRTRIVPPPPPPPPAVVEPPAIGAAQAENGLVTALGTWDSAHAKTLSIKVGDQTFTYPGAPELAVSGSNWTMKLTKVLPPGNYIVTAEASDGVNQPVASPTSRSISIVAPPVPAPIADATMATPPADAIWPFDLTGTWPEGDGRKLAVTLAGKTWQSGATPGLLSDGKGAWTLKPDVALTPGSYDVKVEVTGGDGSVKATNFPGIIKIEAPKPVAAIVAAPVINAPPAILSLPAMVTGLWSESPGLLLQATFDGANYVLRKDPQLTSDGQGRWSFQIPATVADGQHKLSIQTLDSAGLPQGPVTEQTIEINAQPPAAPSVATVISEAPITELKGTWAEGDANQLSVSIANTPISANLGAAGSALTSDGKGNWTFKLPEPLKPGTYDIVVRSTDAAGHTSSDLGTAEVTIKAPEPPAPVAVAEPAPPPAPAAVAEPAPATVAVVEPPPVEPPPVQEQQTAAEPAAPVATPEAQPTEVQQPVVQEEPAPAQVAESAPVPSPTKQSLCEAELARLQEEAPLRFDFNHDGLPLATQPALKSYAAAMLNENCSGLSFNVAGNSDRWGSVVYNQQLSDARAQVIARELGKLGIAAERMIVKGMSEKQPVATEDNIDAWRRNRRVDITVSK